MQNTTLGSNKLVLIKIVNQISNVFVYNATKENLILVLI